MSENENRSAREKVSEGIRQGIGVLSAFKDALEETINEARERGDLSPERAKKVMSDALHKAQEAAGEAKERLDLVSQKEFDGLRETVERLKEQVDGLEARFRGDDATGWTVADPEPPSAEEDDDVGEESDPGPSD